LMYTKDILAENSDDAINDAWTIYQLYLWLLKSIFVLKSNFFSIFLHFLLILNLNLSKSVIY
jgi:hypothetical protein